MEAYKDKIIAFWIIRDSGECVIKIMKCKEGVDEDGFTCYLFNGELFDHHDLYRSKMKLKLGVGRWYDIANSLTFPLDTSEEEIIFCMVDQAKRCSFNWSSCTWEMIFPHRNVTVA